MDTKVDTKVEMRTYMHDLGRAARLASRALARADTATKNRALQAIATEIRAKSAGLVAENRHDVDKAKSEGRDGAFVDRLTLTAKSVEQMAKGVEQVAALPDPIGK